MFDCEKLAAVRARRVPLVPSATHPSKANPVLVEEGAVLVVVVVVLVEDVVVVVVVGGTAALAEYSEIRLPPPQMSEDFPEHGMLQSLGEARDEPGVIAAPHQHSTPYSVPP